MRGRRATSRGPTEPAPDHRTLLTERSHRNVHTITFTPHPPRAISISLKKKAPDYWDGLTKEKSYKPYIKADFAKFCEEDEPEYNGDIPMSGECASANCEVSRATCRAPSVTCQVWRCHVPSVKCHVPRVKSCKRRA